MAWVLAAPASAQAEEQAQAHPSGSPDSGQHEADQDDLVSPSERSEDAGQHEAEQDNLITRFEAEISFTQLLQDENYEQAIPVGERLLELTIAEFGAESEQTATVLTHLGEAQRHAGLHEEAENSFLRAVDIHRAMDGVFAPGAIVPLVGLGSNYHDAGDYLNALSIFNEARSINRRAFGLLDESQIPILDRMSETLYSMGRDVEAGEHQLEALQLVERNHGPNSRELVSALYKYAAWLRRNGRFQAEREQYQRAMEIILQHEGRGSVALVKPLQETGNSFRMQRLGEGQGIGSLRQALDILEAQEPRDERALAEVWRDIGDWQIAFSKLGTNGAEYRRAWKLLENVPDGEELRKDWFSGAVYVLREPISQRGLSDSPTALRGSVLVRFDIDLAGRTDNVVVVESDPPGFKDDAVVRSVRRSRFRPHMLDGELVRGEGLVLQFTYRYLPEDG